MMVRHWQIALVVGFQVAALAAIPMRALRTRAHGADVTLWTVPVDPYDVMSGYYVTLGYEAETPTRPRDFQKGDAVWVTVRRGAPAWTQVSLGSDRPAATADEISIHARWNGWRAQIDNAGRLYMSEAEAGRASSVLAEARGRGLVDLKVDEDGNVSVLRLRVGDAAFGEPR